MSKNQSTDFLQHFKKKSIIFEKILRKYLFCKVICGVREKNFNLII
uniref:Uncharacterized protein n=1 Tax=Meloidogyne enterolobii TaxID=390850 RepID=A0A6V7USC3_MELEN|nr:unnamed protein product [Meloidogyne enterolobii]